MVRPALEAALTVARIGEAADPPVRAPAALRKVLGFARLNSGALAAVRRTLDHDEQFRLRVAGEVEESEIGRASWLWLRRPDEWRREFDALAVEMTEADDETRASHEQLRLQRALNRAEQGLRRSEDARRRAEQEARDARDALARERTARRAADEHLVTLQEERVRVSDERSAAARALKETEASLAATRAERAELRVQLRHQQAERSVGEPSGIDPLAGASPPTEPAPSVRPEVDLDAVAVAVRQAAAAAAALGTALQRASTELDHLGGADSANGSLRPSTAAPGRTSERPAVRIRRRPSALPPGVFSEAAEAADHLVRLPGVLLLVDGYNVSMAAWPGRQIEEQRSRLIAALDELHARTGADSLVVFDGVLAGGPPPGRGTRSVRVRFTDAGVDADDVVMDLIDEFPPDRPVVVASSDQRVRDGARARGANILTARQLLAALNR